MAYTTAKNDYEETSSTVEWAFIILKRWKVVVLVFAFTFLSTLYQVYTEIKNQTPSYTSKTVIMIGAETLEVQNRDGGIIRQKNSIFNEVTLLDSNIIAQQAAGILKDNLGYKEPKEALAGMVNGALQVVTGQGGRGVDSVTISVTTGDSKKSYDIITAVLEGYQKQKKEDEENFFRDTYKTFSEQLDAAHANLLKAENVLGDFIVNNQEVVKAMQDYGMGEQADRDFIAAALNERYLKAKSDVHEAETFLKSVRDLAKTETLAAFSMTGKKYPNLLNLELKKTAGEKEEELNALLLVNEDAHPEVIKVRGELAGINKKINTELAEALKNIEMEVSALKEKEKGLSDFIASGLHEKIITYNMLKRDILVKRGIYDRLAEQLEQINLGEKIKHYIQIRVLEPHQLGGYSKTFPTRKVTYGLVMSLFLCVASVYIIETFDTTIRGIEQLEKLTELPVLATIPAYRKYKSKSRKRK